MQFPTFQEFKRPREQSNLVPDEHQNLAMATMCSHPTARRMWHDPLALAAAMQKEAYHRDLIEEAVNTHTAWENLVEQYLPANKVAPEPAPPLRTGVRDVRVRFPLR